MSDHTQPAPGEPRPGDKEDLLAQRLAEMFERVDRMRQALELIAMGASPDPAADASAALVDVGLWNPRPTEAPRG